MGFNTSGYVLKSARSAPSNSTTTAGTDSGVLREHADAAFDMPGTLVEVSADQYRAAVLNAPNSSTQEYLIWAANSSNLAVLEDASWAINQGTGSIPVGTISVGSYTDGTDRVVVVDNDARSIGGVVSLTLVRGDNPSSPITVTTFASQDADAGVVVLDAGTLTSLGGGLSVARGDIVAEVTYYLAAQKFWWTRNDTYLQRFGWDGVAQKWLPYRGGAPINLGVLLGDASYTLNPRPSSIAVGDSLPGDALLPDSYAMLRVGALPDANSLPVSTLVVSDADAEEPYLFPLGVDAVVGETTGVLQWNPTFVVNHVGQNVWYVHETFVVDSNGILGPLHSNSPLFLCPIPDVTDRPFVRLGSRRHLRPVAVDSDADLALLSVVEGEFGWSRTTGQLKFSTADKAKADPDSVGFDSAYLGVQVVYDGIAMSTEPIGTRSPVQLVDNTGTPSTVTNSQTLFIPLSVPPRVSGVLWVPDNTGTVPNLSVTPSTRPNGSGLVRQITGVGDVILFGKAGAIATLNVVEFESELPRFDFQIPQGQSFVALEANPSGAGSKIALGRKDRAAFNGEPLYFVQADVQPAIYADKARVVSRVREPFVLQGTEILAFALDGVVYQWDATGLGAGSFSASQIAASLDAVITGTGQAIAVGGRVYLEAGNLATGSAEIGFGSAISGAFVDRDLSGCAALGFLPGWRVDNPSVNDNWLPDAGLVMGAFRSPQNLDRSTDKADFKSRARLSDVVMSKDVLPNYVFPIQNPPLLDVAGFDSGVFFQILDRRYRRSLLPLQDVLYDFDQGRFLWAEVGEITAAVTSPVQNLPLGNTGVYGLSLHPAVGSEYGLYVDEVGGPFPPSPLVLGQDFLVDESTGNATLVDVYGRLVVQGARGAFTESSTTFTDPDAQFVTEGVAAGYRLKITSGSAVSLGSYIVASVLNETTLVVKSDVPFPTTESNVTWEVYTGIPTTTYDPALVADVVYEPFNHLPSEPFEIQVLAYLGLTPVDAITQNLNRLVAVASDAVALSRSMRVRFQTPPAAGEVNLTSLQRHLVGVLTGTLLNVPDVTDVHFEEGAFAILIGDTPYTHGVNLTGVTAFTFPLLGDQVEYGLPGSGIEGQINFGQDTVTDFEGSNVYYSQTFLDPSDLSLGSGEIDPVNGEINLSAADMAVYGGQPAAFSEQMALSRDVTVSPLNGAMLFTRPLRSGQFVEVTYYQADVAGRQIDPTAPIREILPLYVRREAATHLNDREWEFNPTSRTVRTDIPVQVWVNDRLLNFSNQIQYRIVDSQIHFTDPVLLGSDVRITYAVNEAFGGESSYTVSRPPVYRPPFLLQVGENPFALTSDRTSDMVPGKLLRIGAQPFFIKEATYNPSSDVTTVTLFPTPTQEVGSRAPGGDVLSLLSSKPVTTSVDGESTNGDPGFLLTLGVSFEPADRGATSIVFVGDVTLFAVPGHIMVMSGLPYIIAAATLSEEGYTTRVTFTSALQRAYDPLTDWVQVSARPIYPPQAVDMLGVGVPVATEPYELIRYGVFAVDGTALPGQTLVVGRDYDLSFATGEITLKSPMLPGQSLSLMFTEARGLAPVAKNGTIIVPRYKARYVHATTPTAQNGFLGAYLIGRYTISSPDAFYIRTTPMVDYLGEVAQIAINRVAARTPHGGPMVMSGPSQNNWDYGTIPLASQARELMDQDRAARVFISLYDDFIRAFEQVTETISGGAVGDRDGKFRFFVGRDRTYGGPGYEDQITGELTPRFVWGEVFEAANGSFGVTALDPLVDPETASQNPLTLEVTGSAMNPWLMDFYIRQQRQSVLNDMDDTVLVKKRTRMAGFLNMEQVGEFLPMWMPSILSRLYPEATKAFTTTYPGLLSGSLPAEPGVYSFLKMLSRPKLLKGSGPVFGSTYQQDIGSLENPALGLITGVTGEVKIRARYPRARILAYSPTGFPEIDAGTAGKPAILATPLPLKDFPVDPTTGLPDLNRLFAQNPTTGLYDLTTGDPDMHIPKWDVYDDNTDVRPQVAFGRPTGDTYSVGYAAETINNAFSGAFSFEPTFKGVFVGGLYAGCIITFTSGDGNEITSADDIVALGEGSLVSLPFEPAYGDTIFVIPPGSEDASGFSNPPSVSDLKKFAAQQPFLDVGVRERRSAIVDRSLPSAADPAFPIKEITNQKTASPLQPVEGDVEFANTMRDPLEFPALQGKTTSDSGDLALPYLNVTNTEIDRLGGVQSAFTSIVQTDGPLLSHTWLAVYPDEVVGVDGTILASASGANPPATLLTTQDFTPVATAGVYTPHSGVGDVRPFDLVLVQKGQASIADGLEGVLSVAACTANTLEVPRFVSPTEPGTNIRYTFNNAMVHLTTTGLSGVVVQENGGVTTTLDISSVSGLVLNDGSGATTGGLNHIVNNGLHPFLSNNNRITIDIISSVTGLILETITINGANVSGGAGAIVLASAPTFTQKVLTLAGVGFVNFAALGGIAPGPVGPFDFRISVDTFISGATSNTGSDTAYIDSDRLTFVEAYDLRTVQPRGATTIGALSVQGELSIRRVTAGGLDSCTVNGPIEVNGGFPFTFLARNAAAPNDIGGFDPSPGTTLGFVKVMAWESSNTPLPSAGNVTFSALPSSDQNDTGPILSGTGTVYDNEDRIRNIIGAGLENVQPGDLLCITGGIGEGACTTGTYIVRHAVPDDGAGYAEVFPRAVGGSSGGWLRSVFPTVLSTSSFPFEITTTVVDTVPSSPSGYAFPSTGRLYLIPSTMDPQQVISVVYTGMVVGPTTTTFTLSAGTGLASDGMSFVSDIDVLAAAQAGIRISGMTYLPLQAFPNPAPSNNVVGFDNGVSTRYGFVNVTLTGVSGTHTFAFGVDLADSNAAPPVAANLGVYGSDAFSTNDSTAFVADPSTPVYRGVPLFLDLSGLADPTNGSNQALWAGVHGEAGVACVFPSMRIFGSDGATSPANGFRAQSGVFVEPSQFRPVSDLGNGEVKVVDASISAASPNRIGMRNPSDYGVGTSENVQFVVRRIRRFHSVLDGVGANLTPLRYAYEIRTGVVATYVGLTLTSSGAGTQLGGFNEIDVNVNPGDVVRLFNMSGVLVDESEVASVIDATTLRLRAPGFSQYVPTGGETFQIYLKQAPVPHAQSHAQLLDLIVEQEILTKEADPSANMGLGTGGRVLVVNRLSDNDIADFSLLNPAPQVGDIVLVDAAGMLSGPTGTATPVEHGARPSGDRSVPSRMDGSHIAGSPSQLDDNRGWYRITQDPANTMTYLAVSGVTDFTGPDGSPVVFGSSSPTNQQFAVVPVITGSGLTGTTEGQMDLRVTHIADGLNSYQDGSFRSIEPFSYRIIRPTQILSEETVDLILLMRERLQSFMEEMAGALGSRKQGSYYVFQAEEHMGDLGSPSDVDAGVGVPSNAFMAGLSGLTQFAPFANTSDCLSVLDRRYWVQDTRLDFEFPPYSVAGDPYASFDSDNSVSGYTVGSGRPTEPDRIAEVLDRSDRIRAMRYSWIKFRAGRESGTLPSLDRFIQELPRLLAEQSDLLRLQQSIDEAE